MSKAVETSKAFPLTASVVIERDSVLHGHRILEFESYYVRSVAGRRWEAARYAAIDTPVRITTGEVAIVKNLGKAAKTPEEAARRMWVFVKERAAAEGAWLVDDDIPEALRSGVNIMPLEKAYAIHDAIAMTRRAGIDAATFLARYAPARNEWRIFRGEEDLGIFVAPDEDEAIELGVRARKIRRGEQGLRVVPVRKGGGGQ